MYAPNFKLPENCISKSVPKREDCLTQADYFSHINHCPGCVSGSNLTKRHNQINYAIARVLADYHMGYTIEPNGFPKTGSSTERGTRKYDGPDGLLTTEEGLTVVEIHCAHARLWYNPKSTNYDTVAMARNNKKFDYKDFSTNFGGIAVHVFTVSTGGVLHPDTIKFIQRDWLPHAYNAGRGLIRALTVEIWFAVARAMGSATQIASIRK